jgi:perosamine synthetase
MEHLDEAVAAKRAIAASYRARLGDVPGLVFQPEVPRVQCSCWVAGLILPEGRDREAIASSLDAEGIETRPFFHPLHRQPALPGLLGHFPRAESLGERGLYLPSYVGLPQAGIDRVAESLSRLLAS